MMTRSKKSARLVRPGVAATELAIWLPFLVLLFAVAVDFCRVYFATQTVQNCAAAGATYASGVSTADPAKTSVSDAVVQAVLAEGVSLNPPLQQANVATTTTGNSVQVSVTYDFPLLTRLPGLGGTVTITRSVTMVSLPQPGS